jgi:hypothetical protein
MLQEAVPIIDMIHKPSRQLIPAYETARKCGLSFALVLVYLVIFTLFFGAIRRDYPFSLTFLAKKKFGCRYVKQPRSLQEASWQFTRVGGINNRQRRVWATMLHGW